MLKIDLTKILSIIKKILFCINNVLGKYILVTLLLSIGLYLSIYFKLPYLKIFQAKKSESLKGGVDKKKLFWVMLGGSVGLGNLIFITSAVLTGGPLTLVFLFIGTFMGLILQYSDIYLSIKFRERKKDGSFFGGTIYLLKKIIRGRVFRFFDFIFKMAFLLYTIEIYQYKAIVTISSNIFSLGLLGKFILGFILGVLLIFNARRIKYLATLASFLMPTFIILYLFSSSCIFYKIIHVQGFFNIIKSIKSSVSFSIAPLLLSMYHGIMTALYSGDICMVYGSINQIETNAKNPAEQARISSLSLITDNFICMVTGLWVLLAKPLFFNGEINEIEYVMNIFKFAVPLGVPLFFMLTFIAGYTTVCSYLSAGQKLSKEMSTYGNIVFSFLTLIFFLISIFLDLSVVRTIMSICGSVIAIISLFIIFSLRKEVRFE